MQTSAGRVLLMPRGDYNASTTYHMLDIVRYNACSYVCKDTTTGNAPTDTTYWQVMTEDGSVDPTKMTYADNGILGAKNLINYYDCIDRENTAHELTATGIRVYSTSNGTYRASNIYLPDYPSGIALKMTADVTVTSGMARAEIQGSNDNTTWTGVANSDTYTAASTVNLDVPSSNYTFHRIVLYCTRSTSEAGDSTFNNFMLRLATDPDDTFRIYAMTNKGLTDKVSSLATVATTGSYNDLNNQPVVDEVKQTSSSNDANYEVLFSYSDNNTTETKEVRKSSGLKYNPYSENLQTYKLNNVIVGTYPEFTDTKPHYYTRYGVTVSAGGTVRIPASDGYPSLEWDGLGSPPTFTLLGDKKDGTNTPIKYKSMAYDRTNGCVTITVAEALSNADIAVLAYWLEEEDIPL